MFRNYFKISESSICDIKNLAYVKIFLYLEYIMMFTKKMFALFQERESGNMEEYVYVTFLWKINMILFSN